MSLRNRLVRAGILSWACLASGACKYEQAEWTFDQGDMEAAVYGTWHGDYTVPDGSPLPLTLEINAPDPSLHPRCGTRTFAGSAETTPGLAPACTVESSLSVAATLSIEETTFSGTELDGYFLVPGNLLSEGELALEPANAAFLLSATWREGVFERCEIRDQEKIANCTLAERD